jgi:hypothetical protein
MTTGIKQFIEDFLAAEATSFDTNSKVKDLDAVNTAYKKMHSYTVEQLEGMLGQIYMDQLRDDSYYESTKNDSPSIPRYLLKISHYKHPKYSDVWVAYTSESSPYEGFRTLSNAFFVIKQDGEFKVGSHLIYSNQRGMSTEFDWEWISGLKDLHFDTLGELIEVERYQEPFDVDDYMKLYLEDK